MIGINLGLTLALSLRIFAPLGVPPSTGGIGLKRYKSFFFNAEGLQPGDPTRVTP